MNFKYGVKRVRISLLSNERDFKVRGYFVDVFSNVRDFEF